MCVCVLCFSGAKVDSACFGNLEVEVGDGGTTARIKLPSLQYQQAKDVVFNVKADPSQVSSHTCLHYPSFPPFFFCTHPFCTPSPPPVCTPPVCPPPPPEAPPFGPFIPYCPPTVDSLTYSL